MEILRLLSLNLILLTSRTLSNMTHLMLSEIQPRFPPIFYIFSLSNMVRFYINLYIYIFSPYFKTLGCTGYPASLPFYSSNIWRHTGFDCRISGRLPVQNNRKDKKSGRKCTRHLFLKWPKNLFLLKTQICILLIMQYKKCYIGSEKSVNILFFNAVLTILSYVFYHPFQYVGIVRFLYKFISDVKVFYLYSNCVLR